MRLANAVFTLGLVAFLAGLGLIDYRASMVAGGAMAMLYAYLLGRLIAAQADSPEEESAPQ